ncbi:S8 family serine peptidase [Streptomyces bikiniensis]|uniref:S8 family serine peptidase n=1 Tax=Streptomyces bikiniensis TaxID=1896 RepID=UPI00131A5E94|nr:S8 family serine peptidase [Streptomyces bikiniensis]
MKRPIGGMVVVAAAAAAALVATVTPAGAGPSSGTASVAEDGGPVAPLLFDETQNGGTVRVNVVTAQRTDLESVADAGQTLVSYDTLPMTTLRVDRAGLEELNAKPGVISVTEDVAVKPALNESTAKIGGDQTVAAGKTGAGTAVAILDTGVAVDHPFLSGRVKAEACFSDNDPIAGSSSLCPDGSPAQEGPGSADADSGPCATSGVDCSHGTHVAGIAAGNGAGLSGAPRYGVAPGADVIAVQVFSKFDSEDVCGAGLSPCVASFTSSQAKGLEKVLALKKAGTDIVAANMSLGGGRWTTACDQDLRKPVVDALRAAGVATVVAAGNNGYTDAVSAPGCISSAITVGSTTDEDQLSSFTNRGPLLDLLAPGTSIVSSVPGGGYRTKNGTSMAAPHVAGALAVLRQTYPDLGIGQLEALLKSNGKAITYTGATTPRIQLGQSAAPAVPGDMNGDRKPDLVAVDEDGKLWLYPGTGTGALGSRIQIGTGGWSGASVAHRGDWTGDGTEDVVAVVGGQLLVYANRGNGTLAAPVKIATVPTTTRIVVPGDVNKDGHPDVVASYDNKLYLYTGTSGAKPAVSAPITIGTGGWGVMDLAAPGDANKDGRVDLLARDTRDGILYHYAGLPDGKNFSERTEYGHGYTTSFRPLIAGAADADRNGVADTWATAGDGTLKFYKGGADIHGPIDGPSVQVGTGGWQTIKSLS